MPGSILDNPEDFDFDHHGRVLNTVSGKIVVLCEGEDHKQHKITIE